MQDSDMQDTDVIDSFLYVMLGIPASGIKLIDSKTGYLFKVDEKMMSSSQNELITRILPIAEAYGVINDFVNSSLGIVTYDTLPSEQGLLPKKNPGLICQALCESLSALIKEYKTIIASFETKRRIEQLSLQSFYNQILPSYNLMIGVYDVVKLIKKEQAFGV